MQSVGAQHQAHTSEHVREQLFGDQWQRVAQPLHVTAHSALSKAYMRLHRTSAAVEVCRKAIATDPDFADAHCNLGLALRQLGDVPRAIEAYEQAIAIDPEFKRARMNRGLARLAMGDERGARSDFEAALEDEESLTRLAGALWGLGLGAFIHALAFATLHRLDPVPQLTSLPVAVSVISHSYRLNEPPGVSHARSRVELDDAFTTIVPHGPPQAASCELQAAKRRADAGRVRITGARARVGL